MDEQEMREAQQRFWNNLKYLCKTHELSLRSLTSQLGISTSPVTKWKNGSWPDAKTLKMIADYFNITLDELLGYGGRSNDLLLGEREKNLVLTYRRMSEDDRRIVDIIVAKYES